MCGIANSERLLRWVDAASIATVYLPLLPCIWHPDAPIRSLYYIYGLIKFFSKCKHVGIHVRFNPVVWLENGYPGTPCLPKATVAGGAVSLVLFVDYDNTTVLGGMGTHDVKRGVGTAIVEADDLEVLVRLAPNAVERLVEIGCSIADRDDDRYEVLGCFHRVGSSGRFVRLVYCGKGLPNNLQNIVYDSVKYGR